MILHIGKYIRFVVFIILAVVILRKIDFSQLGLVFSQVKLKYVVMIFFLLGVQTLIKAYKWHILMRAKKINVPIIKIFQLDYVSTFLSLFFPSSISVDIFRGYGISKEFATKKDAASSIIVDRLSGVFALLFLIYFGLFLFYGLIQNIDFIYITLITTILVAVLIILLTNNILTKIFTRLVQKISNFKVQEKLSSLRKSLLDYRNHKACLLAIFALSTLRQVSRVLIYFFAAQAFDQQVPLKYFFAYVPVIMLIIMLPISMGGIGVREGSFIYFFTKVGLSSSIAFAIPFLVSIVVVINVLPGGLIYLLKGLTIRKDPTDSKSIIEKNMVKESTHLNTTQ